MVATVTTVASASRAVRAVLVGRVDRASPAVRVDLATVDLAAPAMAARATVGRATAVPETVDRAMAARATVDLATVDLATVGRAMAGQAMAGRATISALTPLLDKLGLSTTIDGVKQLVDNLLDSVGGLLESPGINGSGGLIDVVNNLVQGLLGTPLDLHNTVDALTSILENQVPCLLDTVLPKP
ncbi:hypothetical protein H4R23_003713 [Coemansia sp. Cherry 401B]|nr:hypothetical protein IWW52_006153 [Coemansia sp. RSA 2704]KAJ2728072.1 hypothetical protein H4R23_003713 [Coemansia sp. Cherry 401B]